MDSGLFKERPRRIGLISAEMQAIAREQECKLWFVAYGASAEQADELIALAGRLPTQASITIEAMKGHVGSGVRVEAVIAGYRTMADMAQRRLADLPPDLT